MSAADATTLADRPALNRIHIATLVLLLAIAIAFRWLRLANESFWFDEGWTWWLVSNPVGEMYRLMRVDTCAPLYFYLLRRWRAVFGDGIFALRSMSALLTTLAIVPWFFLAREALMKRTSLLAAAALLAVSFMQVQYAREARPYALMGLATVVAFACIPTLARRRSWPALIGFSLGTVAGVYAHNTMVFTAASLALAWLIWPGERRLSARVFDLSIATAIAIVLYLPWVPALLEQLRFVSGNFWAKPPRFEDASVATSAVCGIDVYGVNPVLWVLLGHAPGAKGLGAVVLVAAGFAVMASLLRRDCAVRRRVIAVALVAFGPMVAIFILSRLGKPIFLPRLFISTSLLTPIVFAFLLEGDRLCRWIGGGIITLLFLGGVTSVVVDLTTMQKDDWAGPYAYVKSLPPSSKRLIVFIAAEGELPYAHRASLDPTRVQEPRTGLPQGFFELDPPRTMQRILSDDDVQSLPRKLAAGTYDEIVLVLSHEGHVDHDDRGRRWLDTHWRAIDDRKFRNVELVRYVK